MNESRFASNKTAPTVEKLRGSYYSPAPIADFLVAWAVRTGAERVLEPACGDGVFIEALMKKWEDNPNLQSVPDIFAVDIDPAALASAQSRITGYNGATQGVRWLNGDFFDLFEQLSAEHIDTVVGNPPFIRFQHFDETSRERALKLLSSFHYRPNRLANVWCAFVQLAVELVASGGRLGMIVPAELLQVTYAAELRKRLATRFEDVAIVGFDRLVFPEIQQEILLLLADKKRTIEGPAVGIRTVQLASTDDLLPDIVQKRATTHKPSKHSRDDMKWTSLFLDRELFSVLEEVRRSPRLVPLGSVASVDVGIVTGRNRFFIVDEPFYKSLEMPDAFVPVVGRTGALKSVRFSSEDFRRYRAQSPARLLHLSEVATSAMSRPLQRYLSHGKLEGVADGYKCRIRRRWYDVPSVYRPDAFMFRQIHNAPLVAYNGTRATCTDTIHRVRFFDRSKGESICAASINSFTFAWAEVCGRSYGGGVLELEPKEAEELPIPLQAAQKLDFDRLDHLLRSRGLEEALDYSDKILLGDGLGLDQPTIRRIRNSWVALRSRRRNRRHPKLQREEALRLNL